MESDGSKKMSGPIPVYMVNINTSAFKYKRTSLLEKTQEEYIPHYWH